MAPIIGHTQTLKVYGGGGRQKQELQPGAGDIAWENWWSTSTICKFLWGAFTNLPLLQESRLTGGGSPNLVVLVEWKVPVERFMGAANSFH